MSRLDSTSEHRQPSENNKGSIIDDHYPVNLLFELLQKSIVTSCHVSCHWSLLCVTIFFLQNRQIKSVSIKFILSQLLLQCWIMSSLLKRHPSVQNLKMVKWLCLTICQYVYCRVCDISAMNCMDEIQIMSYYVSFLVHHQSCHEIKYFIWDNWF